MSVLNVTNLSHGFGDRAIFENVSFRLLKGEHVGLIGANGEGKSTFMNIITGKLVPDEGKVEWSRNVRVGYLDQHVSLQEGMTIRDVLKTINEQLDHAVMIINASKGIEPGTHKRVSEIVAEEIDQTYLEAFVALSGPSHAEEVIERALTTVTCAATVADKANEIQKMFNNEYFRVYRVDDLIGVEIGGSIKNVIALAAGIIAGLGYGDNPKAALITRGLVEIKRLGAAVGAKEETFSGLSGLGDLIVTCTSVHSRNWQAGYKIGSGSNLQEAIDSMTMVVEGVRTCQATYEMAQALQIEMPIVETVYEVIFNKLDPRVAIAQLMTREMKPEFY